MDEELYRAFANSTSSDPADQLRRAVVTFDRDLAQQAATRVVDEGRDPLRALEAMTEAIRLIGDGFASGEFFLPELVGAGDIMAVAQGILESRLKRDDLRRSALGTVVIGTVFGDIHTIGKSMVATLLCAEGFTVHDIGISVRSSSFVEAIREHHPDILAMSALLTTTAPEMKRVLAELERTGLRTGVKVMVGGGAITQAFAEAIGADGYAPDAPQAARLARALVGR